MNDLERRLKEVGLSLDIYKKLPPKYVRLNPRKNITKEDLEKRLDTKLVPVKGFKNVFESSNPHLEASGDFYVQDLSSLITVQSLDVRKGNSLLDLCSAPGLKSAYVYDLLGGDVKITCVEKDKKRYTKMLKNFKLYGIQAKTYHTDGRVFHSSKFDRVLVDVPCSGEGIVTKYDEALKFSTSHVKRNISLQLGLLRRGFDLLKPGGLLVYSTCTLNRYENEKVLEKFLRNCKNVKLDLPKINLNVKKSEFGIRIIPGKTRGAFISRIRKAPREPGN